MKKDLSLTIGIAAYNAEKNIKSQLESLLDQKEDDAFHIEKIIIHCDKCTDNTVSIASGFRNEKADEKIEIIDNKVRKGFAGSLKAILEKSRSDITVLLNDDIQIKDREFLKKLIVPFQTEEQVGLVCGNPQPLPPKNFIEKAIISSFRAYENFRLKINNGNTHYTCDGKILSVSRDLKDKMLFPDRLENMGNADTYFYFSCLEAGYKYRYSPAAIVWYRTPNTLKEYFKAVTRNNMDQYILHERFGRAVAEDFKKPRGWFVWYLFVEFVKNPFGSIFIFFAGMYIRNKARSNALKPTATWDTIETSKKLS